MDFGVNYLCW